MRERAASASSSESQRVELQVVRALGERLDQQARAVEQWVSGHRNIRLASSS